jgi:RNA polymerase sigma factor (sigma-70 family)
MRPTETRKNAIERASYVRLLWCASFTAAQSVRSNLSPPSRRAAARACNAGRTNFSIGELQVRVRPPSYPTGQQGREGGQGSVTVKTTCAEVIAAVRLRSNGAEAVAGPKDEADSRRSVPWHLKEFLRIGPELYRFLMRRLRKREDADDFFQAAFERLHRAVEAGYPVEDPRALCFAIATNLVRDHGRSAKLDPLTNAERPEDWSEISLDSHRDPLHEALAALRQAEALASQLTDKQQIILTLDRGAGASNRKIAEMLGYSENELRWQKVLINRIIAHLKKDE